MERRKGGKPPENQSRDRTRPTDILQVASRSFPGLDGKARGARAASGFWVQGNDYSDYKQKYRKKSTGWVGSGTGPSSASLPYGCAILERIVKQRLE